MREQGVLQGGAGEEGVEAGSGHSRQAIVERGGAERVARDQYGGKWQNFDYNSGDEYGSRKTSKCILYGSAESKQAISLRESV